MTSLGKFWLLKEYIQELIQILILLKQCKILTKSTSKGGKETFQLPKSTSLLAEGVESIDELIFDLKFEHSLFKSKFEPDLS